MPTSQTYPIDPFTPEGAKRIAAIAGQPATVSAEQLSHAPALSLPQPSMPPTPGMPSLPTLDSIFDTQPTATEGKANELQQGIANTEGDLATETAFRTSQEQSNDIAGKRATLNDLFAQLQDLNDQSANLQNQIDHTIPNKIQLDYAGRGVTAAGIAPIQTAEIRNRQIQQGELATRALPLKAAYFAAQNRLALAQDTIDQAVKNKFDPLKALLAAKRAQLDAITPLLNAEEKKRAAKQSAQLAERARLLAQEEANQKDINSIMLTAAKYNATPDVLARIQNASSFSEAITAAGAFLQDPQAKYELEAARLDNILKQAQINETTKRTTLLGTPSGSGGSGSGGSTGGSGSQKSSDAIPALNDKIASISDLINSPGLNSSVGPNALSRFAITDRLGAKQNFIAGVQQLVSKDTLDTLINLKAQGGTLGALSDTERVMLQSAASKIGTWAVRDKTGNITGYNVDEKSFKKELQTLQSLAVRARDKALGKSGLVTPDEKAAINQFLSTGRATTAPANFTPASYF